MFIGIMMIVMIIDTIIIYALGKKASKVNGNIVLGTKLKADALDDSEVIKIVDQYKKANNLLAIFSIITYIPNLFIEGYPLIGSIYLILYFIFIFLGQQQLTKKYFRKLQVLKKERGLYIVSEDEDKYWNSFLYNNPHDKKTIVEDRFGFGTTVNIATKKGKIYLAFVSIIILLSIGLVCYLFAISSNAEILVSVKDNNIHIDGPLYEDDFIISDIKDVTLTDDIDIYEGNRVSGIGTSEISIGNYTFDGYGKVRAYLFNDTKKVVVIKLKDESKILINANNNDDTIKLYNKISIEK